MRFKKIIALFLAVAVSLALSLSVFADVGGEIHFSYVTGDTVFSLYRVGDINADGSFSLSGDFRGYSVSLTDERAALTLALYAQRDGIRSLTTQTTDRNGQLVFSSIDRGIYLIIGETVKKGDVTYTAQPVLAKVENGETVEINGKFESETDPPGKSGGGGSSGGGTSSSNYFRKITAVKVWKGEKEKPEITVQLLRNGKVEDETVLNEENNWRCEWSVKSRTDTWSVVEKTVPNGYVASIEKDGKTYIITNTPEEDAPKTPGTSDTFGKGGTPNTSETYDKGGTPDTSDTTDKGGSPTTTDEWGNPITTDEWGNPITTDEWGNPIPPDTAGQSGTSDTAVSQGADGGGGETGSPTDEDGSPHGKKGTPSDPSAKPSGGGEKLPQTGQLWWPVAMLSFLGMLLLIIGIGLKREGK